MNVPPGLLLVVDWIDAHDGIPYEIQSGALSIPANGESGFSILLSPTQSGFDVVCSGWKMYESILNDQMLSLVSWLVSSNAQLIIESIEGQPVRYVLQTFDGAKWLDSKEVKKTNLAFWKNRTTQAFSNGYV